MANLLSGDNVELTDISDLKIVEQKMDIKEFDKLKKLSYS
jgi:hypothetical protein